MKITIDLPDTTRCAFVNFVYHNDNGMVMESKAVDTADLEKSRKQGDTE